MQKLQQLYHYTKQHYHYTKQHCHNHPLFCRHLRDNLVVGFLITILLLPFHHTDIFHRIEDIGIDWVIQMLRATPPAKQDTPSFVVLDVDEATYRLWGEPLITPRDKLLRLIQMATQHQAKMVMVDIELNYRTDRSQALDHPNNQADKALFEFINQYDASCQEPCSYIFLTRSTRKSLTESPYREPVSSFLDPVVAKSRYIYWASTLFDIEHDQVLRRWHLSQPLCQGKVGDVLPSMQLLADTVVKNQTLSGTKPLLEKLDLVKPDCTVQGHQEGFEPVEDDQLKRRILYRIPWHLPGEKLPNMEDGHLLLEKLSVQSVTAGDAKPIAASFLPGRIVVIGSSYESSRDIYATPLGKMPGIWVLVNATHSFLQGELTPPSSWVIWLTEAILIVIMSLVFAYFDKSFYGMLVSGIVIIIGMIPFTFWLFEYGVWLDFAIPLIAVQIHYMHARYEELQHHQHQ
jgi:CHASE2 domain-containing sensor protein